MAKTLIQAKALQKKLDSLTEKQKDLEVWERLLYKD